MGIDPDEIPSEKDEEPESESIPNSSLGNGLNVNEIVVAAVQVPGKASFENYDELKSYLKTGLELYNSTVYSLDNIEQARHDHFVLKSVRKKLTDTKKAIQKEYSMPIELVVQQLDELISMVNGPYNSIDRMLKVNAKEIKRHDIMNYAQSRAVVLGKYANSVLQSPSFFNPRWCNVSYSDSKWRKDVDQIVASAKDSIEYIIDTGFDDVGVILGYYFDKLSLDGIDAFLYNVKKEEPKRQPETVYIDVNTGEIIDQIEEQPVEESQETTEQTIECNPDSNTINENDSADDTSFTKSQQSNEYDLKHEPSEDIVNRQVMLSGTKEQIDKYLSYAQQFDVSVDEIDQM